MLIVAVDPNKSRGETSIKSGDAYEADPVKYPLIPFTRSVTDVTFGTENDKLPIVIFTREPSITSKSAKIELMSIPVNGPCTPDWNPGRVSRSHASGNNPFKSAMKSANPGAALFT